MNRIFNIFILTILFVSPLAYMAGRQIDNMDLVIFQLSAIMTIAANFISFKQKDVDGLPFIGFLSAGILTVFLSGLNNIAVFSVINLFLGLGMIYTVAKYFDAKDKIYNILTITALLNIFVLLFQTLGFSPIIDNPEGEPGGMFGNAPRLAMYLAITLPFVFEKNCWIATLISSLGFILGEIYLPAFGLILWTIRMWKNWPVVLGLGSALLGLYFTEIFDKILHSMSIRLPVWKPTIEQIFQAPMFGHGLGTFPLVSSQFIPGYYYADNAFSSLLQFIFGAGIIGLAGLAYFIRSLSRHVFFLFLALLSSVEYPFEVPKLWLTICILTGVIFGEQYQK